MDLNVTSLISLLSLTLRDPRGAARALMALPLADGARWATVVLMAVLSALAMQLMTVLAPVVGPDGQRVEPMGPVVWAVMVGLGMVMTAGLVHHVGRWRGGQGRFGDALILVAWLQFVQLVLVLLQLVLMFVLPPVVVLVEVLSVGLFLWLLTHFVAELHGFRSVPLVLAGVLGTFVAVVLVLSLVLLPFFPAGV
ncbi:MAG: hypothetical protein RIT14_1776 [Pseudomonadota bacterium]